MDISLNPQQFKTQLSHGFAAGLQILDRIEEWLARMFELTEEERENAAVYLDDPGPHS